MLTRTRARRTRNESGTVAVIVAILSLVLFGTAALSVDLGNAWARKRTVQKQVDVSALSAGHLLPMTTANASTIAAEVAKYLNSSDNLAFAQGTVTADQLLDGNPDNGQIYWQNVDGSTCANNCIQMQVVAPPAKVDFGMASALGFRSTQVTRAATVRLRSAVPKSTLPFWLPSGCGYGAAEADTSNGSGGNPHTPTPTPTPTPTATATSTPTPTGFTPGPGETDSQLKLDGPAVTQVAQGGTVMVSGLSISGLGNKQNATLRIWSPDGTTFVDYSATSGSVTPFQIGTEISNTPGDWWVYARGVPQQGNGQGKYSSGSLATPSLPHLVVRVVPPGTATPTPSPTASPTDVPGGCEGPDRGNFGQLDSPRTDTHQHDEAFALNIALGLDHTLQKFDWTSPPQTPVKDCGTVQHGFIPGAQPDTAPIDDRNCIVSDTGNDGPATYQGFVAVKTGPKAGVPGRLDAREHPTYCPSRSDLPASDWDGVPLNNDVLSCYLTADHTLSDIASQTGVTTAMLDQRVQDSPRFIWLPVVEANDRAQHNFQPIQGFVPAFITDETLLAPAGPRNGLEVSGNSVSVIHVFVFNPAALELKEDGPDTEYDPLLGNAIPRLVD